METERRRATSTLSSVRNAARVLKAFGHGHREYGVTEIARQLGIGKSTAHRLLNTLAEERLLEQNPHTGAYRLGLVIYELGTTVTVHAEIHDAAGPVIEHVRNATRETVIVAVLDGSEVVCIDRREGPQALRLFGRVGAREDAHVGSSGKLLLAYSGAAEIERLLSAGPLRRATPHTITDTTTLRSQFEHIRVRGWAETSNEAEVGVATVAAPIRNRSGEVVAAVSVLGPVQRLNPAALRRLVRPTVEAGMAISRRLGHRESGPLSERSSATD
jgi:IclR family KDG regulon transcriptional repressor